jgi:hypothetical protein
MRRAIELNPFGSYQFVWIDFGIRHVFPSTDSMIQAVEGIQTKSYQGIRIAHIDPLINEFYDTVYSQVKWMFAGGCFGGPPEKLEEFAELVAKKCRQVIDERNHLLWEVNIWAFVYAENPWLFEPYPCDHNPTILLNY